MASTVVRTCRRRGRYNAYKNYDARSREPPCFPGKDSVFASKKLQTPVFRSFLQILSSKITCNGPRFSSFQPQYSNTRNFPVKNVNWHKWQASAKAAGLWRRPLSKYQVRCMPLWRIVGAMSLAFFRYQFASRFGAFLLRQACFLGFAPEGTFSNIPFLYQGEMQQSALVSFLFSLFEGLVLFMRAVYLVMLFTPAVAITPFTDLLSPRWRSLWLDLVHHSLELAGAAFIKWGQWAATRPDLFPRDLCEKLCKLHSGAPAHGYAHTRRIVEGAFGRKIDELFEEFEEEPIASGSIAQVHRAILNIEGEKSKVVAVKVRHPGVSETIRRDFVLMNGIARMCSAVPALRWLRLEDSVQQFAVFMLSQVDLAREAAQLSRFIYNFRSWKDVSFPRPLYPLVHPAVLVETFEQGESVARYVNCPERTRINSALAHIGSHTLLKMLLVDNFIHADMHPGNLLVRMKQRNSTPGKGMFQSQPHLVLLDVGMTAELSSKDRATLLEFFKAVARRDGRKTAECTLRFSKAQTCPHPESFVNEVEACFEHWRTKEASEVHTGDCIHELLEQVRRHRVSIDGDVCTVMVTTLVLEGWQRKLDPEYNIMGTLQTLLLKPDWATSFSHTMETLMAP